MQSLEWRFLDRSGWRHGVWDKEPDKLQYPEKVTGLPVVITRNPLMGNLCGYVGVPPSHKLWQVDCENVSVEAHGGVNFSGFCIGKEGPHEGVCHIPDPGEPANVWWFGFDCGHGFDYTPGSRVQIPKAKSFCNYRDLPYVKAQCANLAKQLMEASNG